jgi:hypothetical protein
MCNNCIHKIVCSKYIACGEVKSCEHFRNDHAALKRFYALRKRVMDAIAEEIENGCKSYEGAFEWTTCYPNYFEDENGVMNANHFVLTLHCYVLGPARHYDWHGKTMSEALDKAEKEISSFIGGADMRGDD